MSAKQALIAHSGNENWCVSLDLLVRISQEANLVAGLTLSLGFVQSVPVPDQATNSETPLTVCSGSWSRKA